MRSAADAALDRARFVPRAVSQVKRDDSRDAWTGVDRYSIMPCSPARLPACLLARLPACVSISRNPQIESNKVRLACAFYRQELHVGRNATKRDMGFSAIVVAGEAVQPVSKAGD